MHILKVSKFIDFNTCIYLWRLKSTMKTTNMFTLKTFPVSVVNLSPTSPIPPCQVATDSFLSLEVSVHFLDISTISIMVCAPSFVWLFKLIGIIVSRYFHVVGYISSLYFYWCVIFHCMDIAQPHQYLVWSGFLFF